MQDSFVFVACSFGFENQCKTEVLAACPNLRFAFSRPGFQTFKVVEGTVDFSILNSLTFVRTAGWSLGKFKLDSSGPDNQSRQSLQTIAQDHSVDHLFYWQRQLGQMNDEIKLDFMKGSLPPHGLQLQKLAADLNLPFNSRARLDQTVLNLIEVDEGEIWYGIHRATTRQQCWPGGIIRFPIADEPISRAYFKAKEAMLWSRFPFQPGQVCVEVGCAPGGSVLALLESDMKVIGIDPAEMNPLIAEDARFEHIRKRGSEVKKKQLAAAHWLFADSNVAPQHTLDTLEEISSHRLVHLRGVLLTLKFLQPDLANELVQYRERVKALGFQYVRTRQLAFNRNEVCLAALKRKSLLRFGKREAPASG